MENEQKAAIATDTYAVSLHGIVLTVYPLEDGTYKVYKQSRKIAHLFAALEDDQIVWDSDDWIDADYITEMGKKIEEYESFRGNSLKFVLKDFYI